MQKPAEFPEARRKGDILRQDFERLLQDIEQEKVPERLLQLALQLQAALAEQRAHQQAASEE